MSKKSRERAAHHRIETSLSEYRVCQNPKCKRDNVIVTGDNYRITCSACGETMRSADELDWSAPGDVLIDDDPRGLMPGSSGTLSLVPSTSLAKGENFTFTCPPDVEGCPIVHQPKVNLPFDMFQRFVWLARRFDTEWLAYLLGTQDDLGDWAIASYYFPRQVANAGHVERTQSDLPREGTIGAIHSHVGMEAFFSAEDKAHFNWPVEMVLNRRGDILANVHTTLQCGRPSRTAGKIMLIGQDNTDEAALSSVLTVEKPSTFSTLDKHNQIVKGQNGVYRQY